MKRQCQPETGVTRSKGLTDATAPLRGPPNAASAEGAGSARKQAPCTEPHTSRCQMGARLGRITAREDLTVEREVCKRQSQERLSMPAPEGSVGSARWKDGRSPLLRSDGEVVELGVRLSWSPEAVDGLTALPGPSLLQQSGAPRGAV